MVEKKVPITNKLGMHARASTKIVNLVNECEETEVRIESETGTADASSIMDLLMIAGYYGSEVKISAEGKQEEEILAKIVDLFKRKFDEGE